MVDNSTPDHEPRAAESSVRRYVAYLMEMKARLAVAYSLSMFGVLLTLALPWPLKYLIDDVLAAPHGGGTALQLTAVQHVGLIAAAIALLAAATAFVLGADKILHARIRERFGFRLREDLIQQVYRLDRLSRHDERSGELTMRLVSDVQHVSRLFCKTAPLTLKHIAVAAGTLVLMFSINVGVGVGALIAAMGLAYLVMHCAPKIKAAAVSKRELEGTVSALTQETMHGIEHIQAMGLEQRARRRYLVEAGAALEAGVTEVRASVSLERSSQIVAGLALAATAGIGGVLVLDGRLSLGQLTVCIAYMTQLLKPIEKINEIASTVSRGIARMDRLERLFRAEPAIQVAEDACEIASLAEISFDSVGFGYPGHMPTVDNFSLTLKRGECLALVGPSGSGKTTVLRLLLRLHEPAVGQITADGIAYPAITPLSLRSQFAVLFQNPHLFAGSLREVLSELMPGLDDERLRQALFDVRLLDWVEQLPLGLDTPLDESADRLSGGQKARLLLARALLSERPVLVLDEPFANIDTLSKRIILQRLVQAKASRILVVVTHEQELLELADHVLEMPAATLRDAVPLRTGTEPARG